MDYKLKDPMHVESLMDEISFSKAICDLSIKFWHTAKSFRNQKYISLDHY